MSAESAVGDTPLVALDLDVTPTVYGKAEWLNFHDQPYGGGSVKSRIAVSMLDAAESRGEIGDRTILEPSSGNTGLALARVGGNRGYDVEIVSYEGTSRTKLDAIREAGGTVHLADTYEGMLDEADRLLDADGYYRPDQYANPANPRAHETGTGPELRAQTDGEVTHFVAGVGSGGTVTGVGRALAPDGVEIIGYEPRKPYHAIDGLKYVRGRRFETPAVYDESVLDDRLDVSTRAAYAHAHRLRGRYADQSLDIRDTGQYDDSLVRERLRVDGDFLVGASAGGAVAAVHELDRRGRFTPADTVVVPLPDRGDRYRTLPPWGRLCHR
ncbi:PLP-dependent cysteine synthase family protein [Salarchaeum sp. JOR-1]|uniref:PLP-dependent cysteine synthase family protein n=1 Tax=Salarchaeum sp. JOR-1 TaxID=2599399 RepID=UPI001198897C|nr:pyridoxal-phosphate dependent enzyme [Salarchaeum sp. JOR-1]QDX39883.1 pyridoxal-phosphate dependent enzyme [Salarchaeum sp. JOR-1]